MLILEIPSNSFDNQAVQKGAEALYALDLLALFVEMKEKAIIWKERVE